MGTVRTRVSKSTGGFRTTTSWGGKRGITNSQSQSNGTGIGRTRTTYSTNQKTGKTRITQSQKVGQNSWYVDSKTVNPSRRGRKRKIKSLSELVQTIVVIGIIFLILTVVH